MSKLVYPWMNWASDTLGLPYTNFLKHTEGHKRGTTSLAADGGAWSRLDSPRTGAKGDSKMALGHTQAHAHTIWFHLKFRILQDPPL